VYSPHLARVSALCDTQYWGVIVRGSIVRRCHSALRRKVRSTRSHLTQAPQAVDRANPGGSPHAPYHDQTAGALLGAAAGLWDERGGDRNPPQRSSSIMAIMLSVGYGLELVLMVLHPTY
jgi:hypothetical protein